MKLIFFGFLVSLTTVFLSTARAYDSVVVFNEAHYAPPGGTGGQWIELYNQNGVNVDLSGWRLAGAVDFTFPNDTVIPGKGWIVIAKDPSAAGIPGALGPWSGSLKSPSDSVRLLDINGRVMDELEYGGADPWPAGADGTGATLSKRDEDAGTRDAASWRVSDRLGGTPGARNFPEPEGPVTVRVVDVNSRWKYLNTGEAPPESWKAADFDDGAWPEGEAGFTYGNGRLYQNGQPLREKIATLYNTGVDDAGVPLNPGQPDPHYINAEDEATPPMAMTPHPAWLADEGVSRFIGFTASGQSDVPAGSFLFRATFDLSGYVPGTESIRFAVAADNSLDSATINGFEIPGATWDQFAAMSGFFTVPAGRLLPGQNVVDFHWTNASNTPNPGGIRVHWDATAEPKQGRTDLAANPVTTWFRTEFTLNAVPGASHTLSLRHGLDDGAVFYLNGREIHRVNLPEGPVASDTPALADLTTPEMSDAIALPGTGLRPGKNVLAVELHQAAGAGRDDAFFTCVLDVTSTPPAPGTGPVLRIDKLAAAGHAEDFVLDIKNTSGVELDLSGYRLLTPDGPPVPLEGTLAAGARLSLGAERLGFRPAAGSSVLLAGPDGAVLDAARTGVTAKAFDAATGRWLTPSTLNPGGEAAFSVNDAIVINEIMYHHHPRYLPTGTGDDPEEWVELYNKSNAPVDLTGWRFSAGITFRFPDGTVIPPDGYLVVAKDAAALAARHPGVPVAGNFSGSLSNSGELIRLEDAAGNPVDEVHYKDGGRWDKRADGGGSSLELIDPRADNSLPESWAASDESGKAEWQTFTYEGRATPYPGSNDPTQYREFVMGLLEAGECLIDDISVIEKTTAGVERSLIQNGTFENGTTDKWRLLGTHGSHGRSVVVDDPAGGGKVLKLVATGPAEHMHNHAETTLKNGNSFLTSISTTSTFAISFRARWVSGSPRLHTRLYFNRLAKQHLLPMPEKTGTPGAPNSRRVPNAGPVFRDLGHDPVVPASGEPVTVRVKASDPDTVAAVTLKWRRDATTPGAWSDTPMTLNGEFYEAVIPGQSLNTQVEFYVEARDGAGAPASSVFPAGAPEQTALVKWTNGAPLPGPGHGIRILMTTANQTFLHSPTNVMSNDTLPCTVIYREREVFYDTRARLKSSQRGRLDNNRVGFAIEFDPTHPFRGVMTTINLDRSSYGRGTNDSGNGQSEIIQWHFFNRAGGIPSMYNDMVYLVAPRAAHTGGANLTMAEFNDPWLDGQFPNGSDTPTFKWELIYYPTTTQGGGPEGLKLAQPDDVRGINIGSLTSPDKEAYRWHFLINNARKNDDYSRIINLADTFRKNGTAYREALPDAIDVDQWLRCFAAIALAGIGDNYASAGDGWHNLKLYQREDGRVLYLPWDMDFANQSPNAPLVIQPDLNKMLAASPAYDRAYYDHLRDIIDKAFNADYMGPWVNHYKTFATAPGDWNTITSYVRARVTYVNSQIRSRYPQVEFNIITNGGEPFEESSGEATLAGKAWVNARSLRLSNGATLPVTWTSRSDWQVKVPVAPGENRLTIEALDRDGRVVGTDTIVIKGTGSAVPASKENLAITELNYHPAEPSAAERQAGFTDKDDFEFIEIRNLSGSTLLLAGIHFTAGLTWQAPPGAVLAPGATAVIPRRATAFALRYPGVANVLPEYYQADGNVLSNSGEEIVLADANGVEIQRVVYGDNGPWPAEADGGGYTLVRIAPGVLTDGPDGPLNWRLSATPRGTPGAPDAPPPPANLEGDDDGDGVPNLVEYLSGGGPVNCELIPLADAPPWMGFRFARSAADARTVLEKSGDAQTWTPVVDPVIHRRASLGDGREEIVIRLPENVNTAQRHYYRLRIIAK